MSPWFLLNSGKGTPAFNMALDEALLESVAGTGRPILRFYAWTEPAASFGYFQKFTDVEHATRLRPLVRRPTGGGIVPHDSDWTYSVVSPPGQSWHSLKAEASYRRIHEWIQSSFQKCGIVTGLATCCHHPAPGQCFAGYEKFDLLWCGKKIAGAAQRRNKLGLLIQGSVQPPPVPANRVEWQNAMTNVGRDEFGMEWSDFSPDTGLAERADALARQKYSQQEFITKR